MWQRKMQSLLIFTLLFLGLISAKPDAKSERLINNAIANNGIVKLTSDTYFKYTQGSRDYGIVILLTALSSQMRCYPCREFDPEYHLVAASHLKSKKPERLFFGHLDFDDGQAVYQQLGLQTAPTILYFPPTDGSGKADAIKYDINRNGFAAEPFVEFLNQHATEPVKLVRPVDYFKLATNVFLGLGTLAVIKLLYQYFNFIIFHKNTWTVLTLFVVLIMTSGHMFNRIRGTPYAHHGPNGQLNYVAVDFQSQFGIETQIIASIYGILAFAVIALSRSVPKFDDAFRQRMGVYVWLACFVVIYSCLIAFFRLKNGAYPFKLFF
ncbi:hypothetical protein DM01DRAFT_1336962 [Hesseltinella vesiculosa]|uniref:Uncharacterized protein n=1 Tax=Hesseltinella vesiculosa TaxID=101127 RepID=A0A1X2GEL2_9FUNG|nr:hypothetical protein DM01DRAFT_1336962 [Hesseltinella vesiculosa]